MIEPKYVEYATARLLKDKGINIYSKYRVTDFNGVDQKAEFASEMFPYLPEQWAVIEYLNVKHNIWIFVDKTNRWYWTIQLTKEHKYIHQEDFTNQPGFGTTQEAIEDGILYALNYYI